MINFFNKFAVNKISNLLCGILLFLILIVPTVFSTQKVIIMVLIVFLNINKYINIVIKKKVCVWIFLLVGMGIFYSIRGGLHGLRIMDDAQIYIFWPIVYAMIFVVPYYKNNSFLLDKVFWYAFITIVSFSITVILLYQQGVLPQWIIELPITLRINSNFEVLNFSIPAVTSLFVLIPYFIAESIFCNFSINNKKLKIIFICLSIILAFMVGRVALIINIAISPILAWIFNMLLHNKQNKKLSKALIIYIVFGSIFSIVLNFFINGYRLGYLSENSNYSPVSFRMNQFKILIHEWSKYPFLGVGYGLSNSGVMSQYYELSYVQLLVQTGLVGLTLFAILIFSLYRSCILVGRKNRDISQRMLPTLVGFTSLLIATASNPYIFSFDGLWIFFYLLAMVNSNSISEKYKLINYIKLLKQGENR